MFTLRFMREYGETVVSCLRYDLDSTMPPDSPNPTGALITAYPGLTTSGGVEFQVGGDIPHHFLTCFVENATGKTIARIGPFVKS